MDPKTTMEITKSALEQMAKGHGPWLKAREWGGHRR